MKSISTILWVAILEISSFAYMHAVGCMSKPVAKWVEWDEIKEKSTYERER